MPKITMEIVMAELSAMNAVLTARKPVDEIRVQARVIFDDCKMMTADDFKEVMRRCRKASPYFPTPFDITTKYAMILSERRASIPKSLPLPKELPMEQLEINRIGIEAVRNRLAKKFSMKI